MVLLLIVIVIIVEGNGFFWWNVIWLHSRERWIAFLRKLRDDWVFFFFAKRDLNRYCFSSFKKKSSPRLKTRLRVEIWLWLANYHSNR